MAPEVEVLPMVLLAAQCGLVVAHHAGLFIYTDVKHRCCSRWAGSAGG